MYKNPIWSTLAHGKTAREAANEFARTCWQEPRKIGRFLIDRFKLVEGAFWYEISLDGPLYHVSRIEYDQAPPGGMPQERKSR